MKMIKRMLYIFSFLTINIGTIYAQNNTISGGGIASGIGGSSSYTIGQVFYISSSNASGSVAQGVQQAYEVRTLSNEDVSSILLEVKIFPNPTKNDVVLIIYNISLDDVNYQLYDLYGRELASQKVINEVTSIQMDRLPTAVYVLKVIKNNNTLKSFKIIKNQ